MKYMGSKIRLAKDIVPILQSFINEFKINSYVEPFCGGCNVIDKINVSSRKANDVNKYLIAMWNELVYRKWEPKYIDKETYNDIKNNKNDYPDYMVGWVGFNCSFKGKFFGGFAGETKTKIDTIRDYQKEALKHIKKQIENLDGVDFTNVSYLNMDIPENSLIYCDPPYAETTGYKISVPFNHEEFWNWIRSKSENNIVIVSEYSAPSDFEIIWSKSVKSSLSANGKSGGNKNSVEKMFKLKRK